MRFSNRLFPLCVLALSLVLPPRSPGQETYAAAADGFLAEDVLTYPAGGTGIGGLAFSSGGDLIVYADGAITVHEADSPRTIATFEPPVFGSFLVLSPDGKSVYFGESTEGNIYRVPLAGGERAVVDAMPFAYDLAFGPGGNGFVSVLNNNPENAIVILDNDPANTNRVVVTDIPGVSGPLAFDDGGNLYYGTAILSQPGQQILYRFAREQVEDAVTGEPLYTSDGEILLEDMEGFYNMRWHDGKLYFTELGFNSNLGTVQVIDPSRNYLVDLLASFPIENGLLSPTFLAFAPGDRIFEAGSGPRGGRLTVAYSNYTSILRVAQVVPQLYFVRGEVNGDGAVDISDAISILAYLFTGGDRPYDIESADANNDGEVDLSDPVYLLHFLFQGGPEVPPPYPERGPAPTAPPSD